MTVLVVLALHPESAIGAAGDLLWTDEFLPAARYTSIVAAGGRVFVAGRTADAPVGVTVRAYDAVTGTLLWDAEFRIPERHIGANHLIVRRNRVVAIGRTQDFGFENSTFVLVASDARTGALLWSAQSDTVRSAYVRDVAASGYRIFVAGHADDTFGDADMVVMAHDLKTGDRLWGHRDDLAGGNDVVTGIAARARRVVVVGYVHDAQGDRHGLVRCYDGHTGALRWEEQDDAVGSEGVDVALRGSRAFVASNHFSEFLGEGDVVLRTYKSETGARLWQTRYRGEKFESHESASRFVLSRSRIFVTAAIGGNSYAVYAFDARRGELLWDSGKVLDEGFFEDMAANDTGVFIAGSTEESGGYHFRLYALHRRTGATLWADDVDPPRHYYTYAGGLTVTRQRIFVTEQREGGDPSEMMVRAYAAR